MGFCDGAAARTKSLQILGESRSRQMPGGRDEREGLVPISVRYRAAYVVDRWVRVRTLLSGPPIRGCPTVTWEGGLAASVTRADDAWSCRSLARCTALGSRAEKWTARELRSWSGAIYSRCQVTVRVLWAAEDRSVDIDKLLEINQDADREGLSLSVDKEFVATLCELSGKDRAECVTALHVLEDVSFSESDLGDLYDALAAKDRGRMLN